MDEAALATTLESEFGGSAAERQAVVRAARDLADSNQFERDTDRQLSATQIGAELADAPDGSPAERWNWWVGALEIAYGGYAQYQVRRWPTDAEPTEK